MCLIYSIIYHILDGFQATELADYIKEKIWQDPIAADLQWSLFLAALKNYKYDSLLRPFPPMFINENDDKDLNALVSINTCLCVTYPST